MGFVLYATSLGRPKILLFLRPFFFNNRCDRAGIYLHCIFRQKQMLELFFETHNDIF